MAGSELKSSWRDTYQLMGTLGEGGVAKVYSARHRDSGRYVAIKVMRQELLAKADVRERFRREALAIREIDSPHVCAVYEFDTDGDEVYMVMEFVEGVTLRKVIRSAPWTIQDISVVLGQVGEALYAAHEVGIVHRDLKPENIVLTGSGLARKVKVLDFGFAKIIEAERTQAIERLTQTGSVFGTPQYMAPEQVMGKDVTAQTDLFALGIIAYEIITGRRPWRGGAPHEVMLAVASKPPPGIGEARCGLLERKGPLEAFFSRALHKDPGARFADAHAMCAALNRAIGVESTARTEDPRAWFEELSHSSVFSMAPISDSELFEEDTDVNPPKDADSLPSSWHSAVLADDLALSAETLDDEVPNDAGTIIDSENDQTGVHRPSYRLASDADDAMATLSGRKRSVESSPASIAEHTAAEPPASTTPSAVDSGRLLMLAIGVVIGAAIASALNFFGG